jgi:hypothetical protein
MTWPHSIPEGLRRRLEAVLSQRHHGPAEIWGEIRDWLEAQGVEKPAAIEVERSINSAQLDQ